MKCSIKKRGAWSSKLPENSIRKKNWILSIGNIKLPRNICAHKIFRKARNSSTTEPTKQCKQLIISFSFGLRLINRMTIDNIFVVVYSLNIDFQWIIRVEVIWVVNATTRTMAYICCYYFFLVALCGFNEDNH